MVVMTREGQHVFEANGFTAKGAEVVYSPIDPVTKQYSIELEVLPPEKIEKSMKRMDAKYFEEVHHEARATFMTMEDAAREAEKQLPPAKS